MKTAIDDVYLEVNSLVDWVNNNKDVSVATLQALVMAVDSFRSAKEKMLSYEGIDIKKAYRTCSAISYVLSTGDIDRAEADILWGCIAIVASVIPQQWIVRKMRS